MKLFQLAGKQQSVFVLLFIIFIVIKVDAKNNFKFNIIPNIGNVGSDVQVLTGKINADDKSDIVYFNKTTGEIKVGVNDMIYNASNTINQNLPAGSLPFISTVWLTNGTLANTGSILRLANVGGSAVWLEHCTLFLILLHSIMID